MSRIVCATSNAGKLAEITDLLAPLGVEVVGLRDVGWTGEIPEDGETFEANALAKAMTVAVALETPTIADDSGLCVDALDGRPGVHSARYAPTDAERLTRLLDEMKEVPPKRRRAAFVCVAVLASPEGPIATATGRVTGRIALEPAGEGGFGYDPIFFHRASGCTFAELSPTGKNAISHRAIAFRKLRDHLARHPL